MQLLRPPGLWMPRTPYDAPASAPSYSGPGDVVSGASSFVGLRAYTAAYAAAGSACMDLADQSTGTHTTTINFTSSGYPDSSAISSFVGSFGTAVISKLYDHTGNAKHFSQTTHANRPILLASALGSYYGAQFVAASSLYMTASIGTGSTTWSIATVAKATYAATGYILEGDNVGTYVFLQQNSATTWRASINAGVGSWPSVSLSNANFHAAQVISNSDSGTEAHIYGDGSSATSGTGQISPTIKTLGARQFGGLTGYLDGVIMEAGVWGGTDFVGAGKTTAMNSNMHAAYGGW